MLKDLKRKYSTQWKKTVDKINRLLEGEELQPNENN